MLSARIGLSCLCAVSYFLKSKRSEKSEDSAHACYRARIVAGFVAVLIVASLLGCSAPTHRAIIGTWKSDTERTLQSIYQVADLPPQTRSLYENDYYGHLIVEYRVDTVRARFDNSNYDTGYQSYQVIEVSEDKIVTSEWNEILQIFETSTTFIDGNCIYGISAKYAFREYFCPFE
jgi:hypothetical protein